MVEYFLKQKTELRRAFSGRLQDERDESYHTAMTRAVSNFGARICMLKTFVNNRRQSHSWSLEQRLSMFLLSPYHRLNTYGNPVALARSSPGLKYVGLRRFYMPLRSLSHSPFTRLVPTYGEDNETIEASFIS